MTLYIRGALQEAVAMAILPFLFLAVGVILTSSRKLPLYFTMLSVSMTTLLLTNLPTAAVIAIVLPIYSIYTFLLTPKRSYKRLLLLVVAAAIGVCCTAVFLLPIVHFYPFMNPAALHQYYEWGTTGNSFIDLWIYPEISQNLYNAILLASIVLLLPQGRFWNWHKREVKSENSRTMLLLLAIALVVQVPYLFEPLFISIPPFSVVQMPGRFAIIIAFSVAYLLAQSWTRSSDTRRPRLILFWALSGILLVGVAYVQLPKHGPRDRFEGAAEYFPPSGAAHLSVKIIRLHGNDPLILTDDSSIVFHVTQESYEQIKIRYLATHTTKATFRLFFWPQWHLTSDSTSLATTSDSIGRLTAVLPAGNHNLSLSLVKSGAEKDGEGASLGGICLLIASIVILAIRERRINGRKS